MKRRPLLTLAAAALAMPAIARAQASRTIRFVPYVDLGITDPVINTNSLTRTHGYLVFDTLYGVAADYSIQPQMVQGHAVDDGLRDWTLTLREGLRFHTGEPVLARDAVASLRRWGAADQTGSTLLAATDELSAPTDRTIRFRMKRPFALLPEALGKIAPSMPCIMPERLAATDPHRAVTEMVGSGPFRFVANERVPGSRAVYERFDGYVPRSGGTPGLTSGPKIAHVDRVEWITIPDSATAAAALQSGEVDWLDVPAPDLLPLLHRTPGVTVAVKDQTGVMPILRFNCLLPPFDNPAIRLAVLSAINQAEFMAALSPDPALRRAHVGAFCPDTPMASAAGVPAEVVDPATARRAILAAGYKDERVVLMTPTDHPVNGPVAQVAADLFTKLGLNVDAQAMDAGTMFQRRSNRGGLDHGGWNCFPSSIGGADLLSPTVSFLARGNGLGAWYGWPTDPATETLRDAWFNAATPAEQQHLAEEIQRRVFETAPYAPLGQLLQPTAYRDNLTGVLDGFAKFYGVMKT